MLENVRIEAFRALVKREVDALTVKAHGTSQGFCLEVGGFMLATENRALRTFKNLTTLARFAKAQNVKVLELHLNDMPSRKRAPATKPAGGGTSLLATATASIPPRPRAAKKAAPRRSQAAKKAPARASAKKAAAKRAPKDS